MLFKIFLFINYMFIPLIEIGTGILLYIHPPKKINNLYGYRTSMSMKNNDTWVFAHKYFSKMWLWTGIVSSIISFFILYFYFNSNLAEYIGLYVLFIQIIMMLPSIILTEKSLRKNFDKNGMRK